MGVVLSSFPPKCGGPPIVNWDWGLAADEERSGAVVWGDYRLSGRYDGERFEVVEFSTAAASPGPDDPANDEPPPARRLSLERLRTIARRLAGVRASEELGYRWLWSDVDADTHTVDLGVDVATRRARRVLARRFGRGVVRLHPQLHLLSRG